MPPRGVEQERQRDLGRETVSTPAGDRTVNTNDRYTGGSTGGAREGFGGGTRELRDRVERDRESRQAAIGRDIARAREARGDGGGGMAAGRDRLGPRSIPGGASDNRYISPLSFGAGISNPSAGQVLALGMGRVPLTEGIGGITGPMVDRLQAFRRAGAAAGFNYPVVSGFRSPAQQADIIARNMPKYGFSPDDVAQWRTDVERIGPVAAGNLWESNNRLPRGHALRANIGLPGRSMHQQHKAADLGGDIYSPEGAKWAHTNAADYGLSFRLSEADAARAVAAGRAAPPYHERHEVWHVEYDPNGNPVAVSDTGRVENIENMVVANVGGEDRLLDMGQAAQMQREWQEVSIGTRGLGSLQDRGLSFNATGTPVASATGTPVAGGTPTTQALDAVETAATTAGNTAPGPLGAGQRMPADTAPRTTLTQPAAPGLLGRILPETTNPRLQNPRPTAEQWAAMSPEDQQRWASHEMWRSGNRGPLSSGIGIMGLAGKFMGEPSQTGFFDPTTGQYYENPEYGGMSFKGLTSTDPANVARNRLGAIANTPSADVDREGPEDRRAQNEAPPIEDEIAVDPNAWNMDDQLAYYDQRAAAAMAGAVPATGVGGIDTIGNYQNPYIQAMVNRPVYPYTTPWWTTRSV